MSFCIVTGSSLSSSGPTSQDARWYFLSAKIPPTNCDSGCASLDGILLSYSSDPSALAPSLHLQQHGVHEKPRQSLLTTPPWWWIGAQHVIRDSVTISSARDHQFNPSFAAYDSSLEEYLYLHCGGMQRPAAALARFVNVIHFINLPWNACDRNDHTTVTAPLPVCSAKLSTVGPG